MYPEDGAEEMVLAGLGIQNLCDLPGSFTFTGTSSGGATGAVGRRTNHKQLRGLSPRKRHHVLFASSKPTLTHRLHHIGLTGNTVKAFIGSLLHFVLCEEALTASMHPPGRREMGMSTAKPDDTSTWSRHEEKGILSPFTVATLD